MLARTYDAATGKFGNLYGNLLDYVISAALIFYILTIAAVFVLRKRRPNDERPYRAFGYPFVPALYIAGASVILILLFAYRTSTTVPGLVIVLIGVPVYFLLKRRTIIRVTWRNEDYYCPLARSFLSLPPCSPTRSP